MERAMSDRRAGTRTPDLYRVKSPIITSKPLCLRSFSASLFLKALSKYHIFDGELMTESGHSKFRVSAHLPLTTHIHLIHIYQYFGLILCQ